MMKATSLLAAMLIGASVFAQTDITTTMTPEQAAQVIRLAVPFPELNPPGAPPPAPVDTNKVRQGFFGPLTRDIAYSGIFAIASLPPSVPVTPELLKRIEAQFHLQLNVWTEGEEYVVEARLIDQAGTAQLKKRYRSPEGALARTAHML
ncbi:MAG: hypothetical protein ACLGH0_08860, partial [Thermoanaerobaculia bacterium]